MLNALRDFIGRIAAEDRKPNFDADDYRLALAALLVHCAEIDGGVSPDEREKLGALLAGRFGVAGDELEALLTEAGHAEREAVDLYGFTSVLKRQMSEDERVRVVESLWEIVFADGASHEFEENLVWRVAELLGVSRQDRLARKRAVAEKKPAGQ
jgi:uncharacterized tellurite resistance protein B-like protein